MNWLLIVWLFGGVWGPVIAEKAVLPVKALEVTLEDVFAGWKEDIPFMTVNIGSLPHQFFWEGASGTVRVEVATTPGEVSWWYGDREGQNIIITGIAAGDDPPPTVDLTVSDSDGLTVTIQENGGKKLVIDIFAMASGGCCCWTSYVCRCFPPQTPTGKCTEEDCNQGKRCTPEIEGHSCRNSPASYQCGGCPCYAQ